MPLFTRANAPWTALVERRKWERSLDAVRRLQPRLVFSAHAPTAAGRIDLLLNTVRNVPHLVASKRRERAQTATIHRRVTRRHAPSR
jgi:hypothetical protein